MTGQDIANRTPSREFRPHSPRTDGIRFTYEGDVWKVVLEDGEPAVERVEDSEVEA